MDTVSIRGEELVRKTNQSVTSVVLEKKMQIRQTQSKTDNQILNGDSSLLFFTDRSRDELTFLPFEVEDRFQTVGGIHSTRIPI